ncbi:MAG TPA: cyclase family protein [Thermoanaerobaculia bacterium]|nr:cyclase family protein [Thermoanaerobaculia bacterium]
MTTTITKAHRVLGLLALATSLRAADGPPVEAGPFRAPDLVEIVTLDPTIHLDVKYAAKSNFLGRPVYAEARAFLQRPAAEALVKVNRELKEKGYGLLVFDGYRPWSVTKVFWDATPPDKKAFVANPAKGSRHNRGCAVDLSLYHLASGKEADMGGDYDEMTGRSYVTYDKAPKEALERRDLLIGTMERAGFFVYPYEWWHFDFKDWREYPILNVPFSEIPKAPRASALPSFDLSKARIVDLTHSFDGKTLYWPTSPSSFELKRLAYGPTPAGFFYAANAFSAPEHGGTHLDAPIHFAEGKNTADEIPLSKLVAPAVVLDVTARAASDPDYRLTKDDVLAWEKSHGAIPDGAIVLLRTGWSARWPDRKKTFGDDTPNDASHLHFPGYGAEAAALLVKERHAGALGVDTPSLDHGPTKDFPVHRVAMEANVPGLENLDRLDAVPETGAWVAALPMKIAGGSGAPLRIVAFVPK